MLRNSNSFIFLTSISKMNRPFSPNLVSNAQATDQQEVNGQTAVTHHDMNPVSAIAANFCLASGLELASLSVQTSSPLHPDLYPFSLTIVLAISLITVANFVLHSKHPVAAVVLDRLGVFLAMTAFFMAIAVPLPLWMKCLSWILYFISLVATVACNTSAVKRFFHSK